MTNFLKNSCVLLLATLSICVGVSAGSIQIKTGNETSVNLNTTVTGGFSNGSDSQSVNQSAINNLAQASTKSSSVFSNQVPLKSASSAAGVSTASAIYPIGWNEGGFKFYIVKPNPNGGTVKTEPTPEPATLFLMGTGIAGIVGYARKRRNKQPE
jgi:PEP-CTERM motif